jgi:hypothetical protein
VIYLYGDYLSVGTWFLLVISDIERKWWYSHSKENSHGVRWARYGTKCSIGFHAISNVDNSFISLCREIMMPQESLFCEAEWDEHTSSMRYSDMIRRVVLWCAISIWLVSSIQNNKSI